MKTLVVGAGAMGRWFASALLEDGPEATSVAFLDADEQVANDAAESVGTAAVSPEAASTYEVVCIAVPIPAASAVIGEYADHADEAIVDVTGTMEAPIEAMRESGPDCERASLHPLFAPANEPGNIPTVVDESGPMVEAILSALRARGNDVFETTPERHDEMMETVQARTHAAVLAFALSASDVPERYHTPISSELTDLAEQVTGGDGRVYADIQSAFEGASDIAEKAQQIADADRETFEQLYEEATRRQCGTDEKGE